MITHEINHYKEVIPTGHDRPGSMAHKYKVFVKAVLKNKFSVGDLVMYKRMPHQIIDIAEKFSHEIEWDGFKPKFVELWNLADHKVDFAHPSDLKRG